MRFTLFKHRVFEVKEPEALIEAYCFQSDFYAKYDLRPRGDESFQYVRFIGARIEKDILDKCKDQINVTKISAHMTRKVWIGYYGKPPQSKGIDLFLIAELTHTLDSIPRVGLSKATKILHTRYPEVIPRI